MNQLNWSRWRITVRCKADDPLSSSVEVVEKPADFHPFRDF
jgi:hypothetical protein